MTEIEEIFKELQKIRVEWLASDNNPSLSEFMQSSAILIRKSDNEPVPFHPNMCTGTEEWEQYFRLPTISENVEKERFRLCESQYQFQMHGLEIMRDINKVNKKEITIDEFIEKHPDIEKGTNNDSKRL